MTRRDMLAAFSLPFAPFNVPEPYGKCTVIALAYGVKQAAGAVVSQTDIESAVQASATPEGISDHKLIRYVNSHGFAGVKLRLVKQPPEVFFVPAIIGWHKGSEDHSVWFTGLVTEKGHQYFDADGEKFIDWSFVRRYGNSCITLHLAG